MNDRQLRAFEAVGKTGSMSKAAGQMYISVPALKKQMDALEKEIGVTLLLRTNQGIALTAAGEVFFEYACRAVSELDEKINRLREMENDEALRIRVCTDNSDVSDVVFFYAVAEFCKLREDVKITVHRVSGFDGRKKDIFFGANYGEAGDVTTHYLCRLPITCIIPKEHPLAKQQYVLASELKDEKLLLPPQEMLAIGAPELLKKWDNAEYIQLGHMSGEYRRRGILEKGIGIVIGFEEHVNDNLIQLPLKGYYFNYRIYSVGAAKKPCLYQFIEFLKAYYPKKCAEMCAQLGLNV